MLEKYVYQLIFKHEQDPENYFLQQSKGVLIKKSQCTEICGRKLKTFVTKYLNSCQESLILLF